MLLNSKMGENVRLKRKVGMDMVIGINMNYRITFLLSKNLLPSICINCRNHQQFAISYPRLSHFHNFLKNSSNQDTIRRCCFRIYKSFRHLS